MLKCEHGVRCRRSSFCSVINLTCVIGTVTARPPPPPGCGVLVWPGRGRSPRGSHELPARCSSRAAPWSRRLSAQRRQERRFLSVAQAGSETGIGENPCWRISVSLAGAALGTERYQRRRRALRPTCFLRRSPRTFPSRCGHRTLGDQPADPVCACEQDGAQISALGCE